MDDRIKRTMEALEKNNMSAFYVETKAEVAPLAESLLKEGDTVAVGGSMSLFETGVIELLRNGKYNFLDRYAENLTPADIEDIYRKSYFADCYLCSTNAVTVNGELYNVDGNSNRVSAIAYGPKSVIMVVGVNKIVENIDEAVLHVKNIAAPLNAKRLSCDTYCAKTGHCVKNDASYDGCNSPGRICRTRLICDEQRIRGRIKIIFVGEPTGY